jgi:hypothetical protein
MLRNYQKPRGLKAWGNPAAMTLGEGRPIKWSRVSNTFAAGAYQIQSNGAAAINATSITVDPLPYAVPKGTEVTFTNGETTIVTADTGIGAVTLPVTALQFALPDNTVGYIQRDGYNTSELLIPETTIVCADATDGLFVPIKDALVGEKVIGFLVSDASNSRHHSADAKSGYGVVIGNTDLYENLLADSDDTGVLATAYKTRIKADTLGFTFKKYFDSRAV